MPCARPVILAPRTLTNIPKLLSSFIRLLRLCQSTKLFERQAAVVMGDHSIWLNANRLIMRRQGLLVTPEFVEGRSLIIVRLGHLRVQLDRSFVLLQRFLIASKVEENVALPIKGSGIGGIYFNGSVKGQKGFVKATHFPEYLPFASIAINKIGASLDG